MCIITLLKNRISIAASILFAAAATNFIHDYSFILQIVYAQQDETDLKKIMVERYEHYLRQFDHFYCEFEKFDNDAETTDTGCYNVSYPNLIFYSETKKSNKITECLEKQIIDAQRYIVNYTHQNDSIQYMGRADSLNRKIDVKSWRDIIKFSPYPTMHGYLPVDFNNNYISIIDIIKESHPIYLEETDSDQGNIVCSGTIDCYEFTLEFSSKYNYALVKANMLNKRENLHEGYRTYNVKYHHFQKFNEIYVPGEQIISYTCITTYLQQGNNSQPEEKSYPRTVETVEDFNKISFNKHNIEPTYHPINMKLPNGTHFDVRDAPQIEYIWMDGKIVPKTDERMLAIAQGEHKFIPSPKESRFWLILLGIVGILVGGGWKLYNFWTSDREPTSPKPKNQAV